MPQLPSAEVLDGRAVAELLHLPQSTVLEFARRGVIPAQKLGRRWLFLRDEVDAAVRAAPANPTSESLRVSPPRRRTANTRASQLLLPLDGTLRQTASSGGSASDRGEGRDLSAQPGARALSVASVGSPTAQQVAAEPLRASAVSVPLRSARATPAA